MLIDSHAHLNDERLIGEVEEIVNSMPEDGLESIINVGYDLPSSEISLSLAEKYENIYSVVGIHPHDSKTADKVSYDYFAKAAENKKVLAIGEIGLDYYYDLSPREVQKRVFVEQLELAVSLKLPVVLHLRDAFGDMLELLKQNKDKLIYGALMHCYSGSKEMLREFLKFDMYFSYGGAVTFKKATEKPEVVRSTPIDRILLETDCPYMTPEPYRGRTNYPKYVGLVAQKVGEFLSKPAFEVADITNKNTKVFFNRLERK